MPATPFIDPDLIAGSLYSTPARIAERTGALHAAKISGGDATAAVVDLAASSAVPAPRICDIGCGRGTTTLRLATRLAPAQLIAVDQSRALLGTVAERLDDAGHSVRTVCADFHHLPLPDASIDIAVAANCLYHSARPADVVAQIARCLTAGGRAVLVTKSADSYRQIDELIAEAGLDPDAAARPSLYETFHGDTAPGIVATSLRVEQVLRQQHVFRFAGLDQLAGYVDTSPKYHLPDRLAGSAGLLADEFRRRLRDRPVVATSTVTYVKAVRP
ncbi:class I SAM-dependent methyltransferase [Amycolatopsis rubida]|uniref:Class I SAM-dependent methyltransferase n=2 Tax=Amycolatopsis TaxID=1813 RepID=A0ABX0BM42_9PSEU|nr:class I SAM-dependent methyltransferase [Amycolatopsis rubida]MYW91707.1 methyltransferase domain-containing protein [Amycolatopsis rubida]NEC56691.1 class I SAM-dependent methyltransferase [Amycolatopsis rubida]OAP20417.1 tRNA (cmo5U34)-methyltransferase [Amycolatopsis sp. M39]